MDTSMIKMIQTAATNRLYEIALTNIEKDDLTKGGVVRAGLLQDDPTDSTGINVLTHPNHPDVASNWKHMAADEAGLLDKSAVSEIGGCDQYVKFWARRYTCEIQMFFPRTFKRKLVTRDQASEAANVILSRLEHGLFTTPLPQGTDSFYERALRLYIRDSWTEEGGGERAHQWFGYIKFEVLTVREYTGE